MIDIQKRAALVVKNLPQNNDPQNKGTIELCTLNNEIQSGLLTLQPITKLPLTCYVWTSFLERLQNENDILDF